MLQRTLRAAVNNIGERTIIARASDESPGRDGLIIRTAGIDLRNYRRNPVVLASHDPSRAVGRCSNIRTGGTANDELIATIEFAPAGVSHHADEICALCKNGVLNSVSIGFEVIEYGPKRDGIRTVEKSELLEISIVAVPALPSAAILERGYRDGSHLPTTPAPLWPRVDQRGGPFMVAEVRRAEAARVLAYAAAVNCLGDAPSYAERQADLRRRLAQK